MRGHGREIEGCCNGRGGALDERGVDGSIAIDGYTVEDVVSSTIPLRSIHHGFNVFEKERLCATEYSIAYHD
jgi:hypothetical protein